MSSPERTTVPASELRTESEAESKEYPDNHSGDPITEKGFDAEKAAPSQPPGGEPPDGGLQAWLVVLGVWCTSFATFGWLNSIGVFQQYYQDTLLKEYAPSTVAWIPSLQIFFLMGTGPIVGLIYDKYGPRWLIFGGSILHVFGIMMASLSTEYYQILLAQGVCSPLGMSTIFQPAFSCVYGWFLKKRGAAFGVLFTGSSVGGVIFPIMVSRIINTYGSFAWAMRASGFMILFLLIIANLTIRPRVPPPPQKVTFAQLKKPFKELDFVLIVLGFFCFSYGFFVPINYLPLDGLAAGIAPGLALYLLPVLNAGSLFGRLFAGFLSDKIGKYNVFSLVCALSGVWILALWLPDTSEGAEFAFAVLFGFCSGAFVSLISPMIFQISPLPEIGFRTGIALFFIAIGGLTTNPINGAILDNANSFVGLKIFSGVFCLAGTALIIVARGRWTGWRLRVIF